MENDIGRLAQGRAKPGLQGTDTISFITYAAIPQKDKVHHIWHNSGKHTPTEARNTENKVDSGMGQNKLPLLSNYTHRRNNNFQGTVR